MRRTVGRPTVVLLSALFSRPAGRKKLRHLTEPHGSAEWRVRRWGLKLIADSEAVACPHSEMSQITLGMNSNATDRPTHIVIYREGDSVTLGGASVNATNSIDSPLVNEVVKLLQRVQIAEAKILELETKMSSAATAPAPAALPTRSPWFGASLGGIAGVEVRRLSEAQTSDPMPSRSTLFDKVIEQAAATRSPAMAPEAVVVAAEPEFDLDAPDEEAEEAEDEQQEEQEVDAEEEPPEIEEEVEEEEEQEEAVEYVEFEYKGVTYFRDDENQVYQLDEDGDLDDTAPIGVWNPEKQKVLKYKIT